MNHLRVVLGLMMLGSALWLVSLLTIHIGRTPVLTLLVILAIFLLLATAWRYRWRTRCARALWPSWWRAPSPLSHNRTARARARPG